VLAAKSWQAIKNESKEEIENNLQKIYEALSETSSIVDKGYNLRVQLEKRVEMAAEAP
jgi:D-hexose-6-phosphate mutarotase